MPMTLTRCAAAARHGLLRCALLLPTVLSARAQVAVPPDAPTAECKVIPSRDPATLRILDSTAPVTLVFACSEGKCLANTIQPKPDDPQSTHIIATGERRGAWTCVFFDSVPGWIASNRLVPPPSEPAVPAQDWLGSYRMGKDLPHIQNNRLVLTPGTVPGSIHVSGQAFWYGSRTNVHDGAIEADAIPYGRYLHVVDGTDETSCVLDLVIDPAGHSLSASDNAQCGGMNVRFWGRWERFAPARK